MLHPPSPDDPTLSLDGDASDVQNVAFDPAVPLVEKRALRCNPFLLPSLALLCLVALPLDLSPPLLVPPIPVILASIPDWFPLHLI